MDWFTKPMVTAVVAILALAVVRDVCAQPPPPPPCQTIFLPDGRMIICCTTGSVTTCM